MEDISGIYSITNTVNGRWTKYIGSSCEIGERFRRHKWNLGNGTHYNDHLQKSWNKYGGEAFVFQIVELVERERLLEREQHWLDEALASADVYNVSASAESPMAGRSHTDEAKRKISEANKGRRNANDGKAYLSIYNISTGEVIPAGKNAAALCRSRDDIAIYGIRPLLNKKVEIYKKWILNSNRDIVDEIVNRAAARRRKGIERMAKANTGKKRTSPPPSAKPYPAFVNIYTGEKVPAGIGLSKLCREKELDYRSIRKVARRERSGHKGWILADANVVDHARRRDIDGLELFNTRTGETVTARGGITDTALMIGVSASGLESVVNKRNVQCLGWVLASRKNELEDWDRGKVTRPYPALVNIDTGEVIPAGRNIAKLCRERNLSPEGISTIVNGDGFSSGRWTLRDPIRPQRKLYPIREYRKIKRKCCHNCCYLLSTQDNFMYCQRNGEDKCRASDEWGGVDDDVYFHICDRWKQK